MCDCTQATGSFELEKFAGVYCEHKATAYCKRQSFFCTNGGECRDYDDGCKCPPNYEGHYCQFVKGARPSDWSSLDYMHPALLNAYHNNGGSSRGGGGGGMSDVGIVATVAAGIVVLGFLIAAYAGGKLKLPNRIRRGRKEMDTAAAGGGAAGSSEFVAGESVYKKKTSTGGGGFVTEDTLDADGGVLKAALEGGSSSDGAIMEEVDLNDDDEGNTASTPTAPKSPIGKKGEII